MLKEISRKVSKIQDAALSDFQIRDINDELNRLFKEKVGPAVEKYRNIGVRIEDSLLLTETGLKSLSQSVPRTVADVEAWLRRPAVSVR